MYKDKKYVYGNNCIYGSAIQYEREKWLLRSKLWWKINKLLYIVIITCIVWLGCPDGSVPKQESQEAHIRPLSWEHSLEEEMATHSSIILAFTELPLYLCQKSAVHVCEVCIYVEVVSGFSLLFHWCMYLFPCQYHAVLVTVAIYQVLKLNRQTLPTLFYFKIVLAILVLLPFHIHFRKILFTAQKSC